MQRTFNKAERKPYFRNGIYGVNITAEYFESPISVSDSLISINNTIIKNGISNTSNDLTSSGVAFNGHTSATLLDDGRVFCGPASNGGSARIYNPITNTVATAGGGTFTVSMGGICKMADGKVFLAPFNNGTCQIYNPATDTRTTAASGTNISGSSGCVLMDDGRIFIVRGNATANSIYDPVADTVTNVTGVMPGSFAFGPGLLLPDGRIFISPANLTTARIWDPVSETYTTVGTFPTPSGNGMYGATLLKDGRVFCSPCGNVGGARIYDPVANTTFTTTSISTASFNFFGCCLIPDGRVVIIPGAATQARIYNPDTDTVTLATGTYSGNDKWYGGVTMLDGRVFMTPYISSVPGIVSGDFSGDNKGFKKYVMMGPVFNHQ